jgi:hypothetical protein
MSAVAGRRALAAARASTAAVALATLLGACEADRVTSSARFRDALTLETSISAPIVRPGQPATFTHQLRNVSSDAVTVIFGGCGPLPYIKHSRGDIVHPDGGGWVCPGVITRVTLAPGQAMSNSVEIASGEVDVSRTNRVTLRGGSYRGYADVYGWVEDYDHRLALRTPDVSFEVRD